MDRSTRNLRHRGLAAALAVATLGTGPLRDASAPAPRERPGWEEKVESRLLLSRADGERDLLVELADRADLSGAWSLPTRAEKRRFVIERLQETARLSQAPLTAWLRARGIPHRAFWITNTIRLHGSLDVLEALARRPEVARIEENRSQRRRPRIPDAPAAGSRTPTSATAAAAIPWNLALVGAPDFWDAGFEGQGIVVGTADTGVDSTHPALKPRYRGWNGTSASHAYNWHDAIHTARSGNACGSDSPAPCDDDGHGTMTLGIAVGDDGGDNRIGMAPQSRWIGCRDMDEGEGSPATYTECFQWFLAPTDSNDANPRPDLAPDVITNSWDCPPSEGCTTPDILRDVVDSVRAAGIVVVVSAGNDGPTCDTIGVPGRYAAALTVGSTDPNDDLTDYSSRGPGDAAQVKPDVLAPGEAIRSSQIGGTYGTLNGTSAAAPHVAGLAALLLSASTGLADDLDTLEAIVRGTSVPKTGAAACGGVPAGAVPNNAAGYGRIDAGAAFLAAKCPASAPVIDAPLSVPPQTSGHTASVPGLPGHGYSWSVTGGSIASGQGQNAISFDSGAAGTLLGLSVIDSVAGCASPTGSAKIQVDFSDAPPSHLFHTPIVKVARAGITTGCGGGNFCPEDAVTRAQMAVFILRAVHGAAYKPPTASGTLFTDVPTGTFLADWIEQFSVEGFTTGCGGGRYCPDDPLNRAAAAVFLLRGKHTPSFAPPAAKGNVFGDVPPGTFLGAWIEELSAESITSGCGNGNYCPDQTLSRGEMAAFLARTFSLP